MQFFPGILKILNRKKFIVHGKLQYFNKYRTLTYVKCF